MTRIIIFTNNTCLRGGAALLVKGTLDALKSCDDLELVAVCVPQRHNYAGTLRRFLLEKIPLDAGALFDPAMRLRPTIAPVLNLNRLARRHQFKLIAPPGGDLNHPQFIARLRCEFQPTIALSFYCLQKFSPELLEVFCHAVNYHNGLLPGYRGLKATAWSVYHGEQTTGFTFHRMTRELDEGPMLIQGALPVCPDRNSVDLDLEKAAAAAMHIPQLLRMIVDGAQGQAQNGKGSFFSKNDWLNLTKIPDPSTLSSSELARRLRAFECLRLRINNNWRRVRRLKPVQGPVVSGERDFFRTADGVMLEPAKNWHLPYALYWMVARLIDRLPFKAAR